MLSINENKTSEQQREEDDFLRVESSDKIVIVDNTNKSIWEIASNAAQVTFIDDYAENVKMRCYNGFCRSNVFRKSYVKITLFYTVFALTYADKNNILTFECLEYIDAG